MVDATFQMKFGERASGQTMNGTLAQAVLSNVIGGTPVLNANFATQTTNATTFTPAVGGLITVTNTFRKTVTVTEARTNAGVNQIVVGDDTRVTGAVQSTLVDAKGDLLVGTAADTVARLPVGTNNFVLTADSATTEGVKWAATPVGNNDMGRVSNAIYLSGTGLSLNGATGGNTATTPDAAALDITGDIDIVVRAALADWNLATTQVLVAKRQTATTLSYRCYMYGGYIYIGTSTTGSDVVQASSPVTVGFSAGQAGWVRVTRDATTGDVKFYKAADSSSEPSSWSQLGATQSTTPSGIYNSNSQLEIGSNLGGGSGMVGTIYRAILRNGIGGTIVFDANFATQTADALAFTESSSNAATVTVTTTRYAYGLPGVQFNGAATQALTANTIYYAPFEVTAPITLDFMALEIATGTPVGNLRLGVYAADSNLQPTGAPLFDSGDLAFTTAGILSKQGTPVTLQPGVYLTATNSSAGITVRAALGGQTMVNTAMGTNLFTVITNATQTQGAFPTPGTPWTTRVPAANTTRHVAMLRWR
jgi:hypothetical protein